MNAFKNNKYVNNPLQGRALEKNRFTPSPLERAGVRLNYCATIPEITLILKARIAVL